MGALLGMISQENVLQNISQQLYPLIEQGHCSATLISDQASAQILSCPTLTLHMHLHGQSAHRVLIRFDWDQPHHCSIASSRDSITVCCRGLIENSEALQDKLSILGYISEPANTAQLAADLIHWHYRSQHDLLKAVHLAASEIIGVYAISVMSTEHTGEIICTSRHIPLFIAKGVRCIAFSDQPQALQGIAPEMIRLGLGDTAKLSSNELTLLNPLGEPCIRATENFQQTQIKLHGFHHYMQKEINEQAGIFADILDDTGCDANLAQLLNNDAARILCDIEGITLLASGSSYHAALTARYWFESLAGLPCTVELASEYRYRDAVQHHNTLIIAVSQSGETADTIAALKYAQSLAHEHTLAISNASPSSLMQLARFQLFLAAGPEIGITSTKTFSTQLLTLYRLALCFAKLRDHLSAAAEAAAIDDLRRLPRAATELSAITGQLQEWAQKIFTSKQLFFVGRHLYYPLAQEAALKMQEVAYIHAFGFPAGELVHGPLTLVNKDLPVIACLPWNRLTEKLLANLQEIRARDGELFILSDAGLSSAEHYHVICMANNLHDLNPILYGIALQTLAYNTAILQKNDVDTPRFLSKSVTKT
ncbi:glutamine--fructose-6-phosphate transaminase (isomerizing) [Iodobacter fluviatilis]|uniref:Glutamine--fructose-6-phosphate aminotransferase [isomerizing] n=1 Tax=Iodobacter fluviatilis TaxID=537 RepID=A0A377Q584_9NEIS|nr:glutamine--fructose-6-phosphate transaminase (isomerizing) [Iodobacter fluviatilis]TCU84145.1 glucosamine--fructose-6-phosphate aminotransferase (isomerizing) [Iodobacter fluviatilis]STQ89759.1 Glucosamine--fructose-6-phosphate aminotransferase [isomerizing] [Iodobacter fluviatilis]